MENFLHSIFLGKCYLCDLKGEIICEVCLKNFQPFNNNSLRRYSFFEYNDQAKKLLYLSKYSPYYFVLLKFLTRYALNTQGESLLKFLNINKNKVVLCPIPLSSLKLFERRFNQAETVSFELMNLLDIQSLNIIKRVKDTAPLYDLDKHQRRKELEGAFRTSISFEFLRVFKIKTVIMIDDLVTTSQTFLLCYKILRNKGIQEVKLVTLFSKK